MDLVIGAGDDLEIGHTFAGAAQQFAGSVAEDSAQAQSRTSASALSLGLGPDK
jgi:hypothetical protein